MWSKASLWLDIKVFSESFRTLEDYFKLLNGHNKQRGGICFSAVLWCLWKARNFLVFQNHYLAVSQVLHLIKVTTFNWSETANFISLFHRNLWWVDPLEAVSMHMKRRLKVLMDQWFKRVEFIGLVDGSWKSNDTPQSAGIGGFLSGKNGKIHFIFSGPADQQSAFDTELEALVFMLQAFYTGPFKNSKLAIFLDSKSLVHHIVKGKLSPNGSIGKWETFKAIYIERDMNYIADHLAKKGRRKKSMVAAWLD